MLPALDAILGHKSAHSLETGPVMAEPFISPWKQIHMIDKYTQAYDD